MKARRKTAQFLRGVGLTILDLAKAIEPKVPTHPMYDSKASVTGTAYETVTYKR